LVSTQVGRPGFVLKGQGKLAGGSARLHHRLISPHAFGTKICTDGTFKIFPSATTDLVIDVSGFFAP
jgi:hypothetical protein